MKFWVLVSHKGLYYRESMHPSSAFTAYIQYAKWFDECPTLTFGMEIKEFELVSKP